MSAIAQASSASITPNPCSNSPSVSAFTSASIAVTSTTSPNTPPMVPSSQKELIGDHDNTLSSLSPLSSLSSPTQPFTPPNHSASTTLLSLTSPSSLTCVDQPDSPSEKLRATSAPLIESELTEASPDATVVAKQQVAQKPSYQGMKQVETEEDIPMDGTCEQTSSSGESEKDLSHTSPQAVKAACSTKTPNPLQTTNVYINGLPPNFKAEQLYTLASQFGSVISCRTFTRQLSDHPSGYGFVLFDSMEAAQQCIDVLRSHHNLHPTFAKQAHKINRAVTDPMTTLPSMDSFTTQQQSIDVFSRTGTNVGTPATLITTDDASPGADVYIIGLPMSVDVPTLRILLSPHVVRSSRFFADTRVVPPRLVAFVKLESQAAAHDVYSKLHKRTIRGYSDRLQVFSESEFALQLVSTQSPQVISPRTGTAWSTSVASGMPMNVQDLFTNSEDPFVSLGNDNKTQFTLPSFSPKLGGQSALSHDMIRLQALQQQVSRQLSKQSFDQHCLPPQLQPLHVTLNQLQAQLDNLRPLLYNYSSNEANSAVPSLFETSPTISKVHQRLNSYSDSRVPHNAFQTSIESSQVQDDRNGITITRKQAIGSQLNPLAHAYPSKSSISTNSNAVNCLQSVLSPTSSADTAKAGLGPGASLFTRSQSKISMGSVGASIQAKSFFSDSNNNHKNVVAPAAVAVSTGSGGRLNI